MNGFKLKANNNDDEFFHCMKSGNSNLRDLFNLSNAQNDNVVEEVSAKCEANPKVALTKALAEDRTKSLAEEKQKPLNGAIRTTPEFCWSVSLAKLVTAFRESNSVGKVGAALICGLNNESKIVLYKNRNNIVATCTLQPKTETLQPIYRQQAYLQFYDDTQNYWSLLFEKPHDEAEFTKALKTISITIIELEQNAIENATALVTVKGTEKQSVRSVATNTNEIANGTNNNDVAAANEKETTATTAAEQQLPNLQTIEERIEFSDESLDVDCNNVPLVEHDDDGTGLDPAMPPTKTASEFLAQRAPQISSAIGVYNGFNFPLHTQDTHFMQLLLTENRTQNTELRMNIIKLENKLEKLLDKVERLSASSSGTQPGSKTYTELDLLELEEKLSELKKTNRNLKQTLDEARAPPQTAEMSIDEFLKLNAEQLQTLDIRTTQVNNNWHDLCKELIAKSEVLQMDLQKTRAKNDILAQELREKTNKLVEQNNKAVAKKNEYEAITLALESTKFSLNKQQQQPQQQQRYSNASQEKRNTKLSSSAQRIVKEIMNKTYTNVATQLDAMSSDPISNEQFLNIIAKVLKYETLKLLQ